MNSRNCSKLLGIKSRDKLEATCDSRRQTGGEHHITIPRHESIRIGTLNEILRDVGEHFGLTRDQIAAQIFKR